MDMDYDDADADKRQRHWTENIGRQLAADACVTVLLVGIDRLLDWPLDSKATAAMDRLPDNVRIIGTTSPSAELVLLLSQQDDSIQQDQTTIANPPPVAWPPEINNSPAEGGLDSFFDRLEETHTTSLVKSVASVLTDASGLFHCRGITVGQLQRRVDDLLTQTSTADDFHQLIKALGLSTT